MGEACMLILDDRRKRILIQYPTWSRPPSMHILLSLLGNGQTVNILTEVWSPA